MFSYNNIWAHYSRRYALSDSLTKYYDVQLTPKHLPMRKDTPAVTVLSPSSMPVDPHQEARLPQRKAPPVYNRPKAQPTRVRCEPRQVYDQVRLKPACAATETSWRLEISYIEKGGIILYRQRKTKLLIRLCRCAGWSASLLFAYGKNRFSHDEARVYSL